MNLVTFKKITLLSSVSLLVLSGQSYTAAESIPDIYKFVPANSLFTLDIKTSEKAWSVISKSNPFNNFDPFNSGKSKSKTAEFDLISDPEIASHLGNNIVFSCADINMSSKKDVPFLFVAEMKNTGKHNYIKGKIKKIYGAKTDTQLVESAFKDASVISAVPKNPANLKFKPSYFVFINNYVINTNDLNLVQDSVKSYYKPSASLSASPNFSKSYGKLGSDYQMQLYLNMKKFARMFSDIADSDPAFKSLKNQNIFLNDSMLLNLHLYNKSIELKSYTIPDKSSQFMKQVLRQKPSNFKNFINYVPKDALAFMGFSDFNFNDYFSTMLTKEQTAMLEKVFKDSTGITMKDVYSNMKDDTAFAAFNTEANPLIPGFVIFLTPKDKERMARTIGAFKIDLDAIDTNIQRGNRKKRQQSAGGLKKKGIMKFSEMKNYRDLKIAITNEVPELSQVGIRPAYTLVDGKVIFASNEEVMKNIIDRVLNKTPDFTLEKNASFENIQKYLGSKNNSFGFINLNSVISMIGTMTAGKKDSVDVMANLKKFHAVGFNSINDRDGMLGRVIILADVDQIDFDKLFPDDNKKKIDLNKSKSTFY